jgi:prevent-host-death family protein
MKKFSISDAKNRLSSLIDGVKNGTPVLIVDRGRPVARLEAVTARLRDDEGAMARLVREGVVRPPREPRPSPRLSEKRLPESRRSAVRVLLDERREGR